MTQEAGESEGNQIPRSTSTLEGPLRLSLVPIAGGRWQILVCFQQESQKPTFMSSTHILDLVYACVSTYACECIFPSARISLEGYKRN